MPDWPPKTIILVDDESIDNRCHSRVLRRAGFEGTILTFAIAAEALDYLESESAVPVDMMFLDINMPLMDGFDFLERAHAKFGGAFDPSVVIMLTTSLDPADRARAAEFDVIKSYISKPLTAESYAAVLDDLAPERRVP